MRRKYILGLQPLQPTSKGEEYTVKVDDNLIIIWRFDKKQMTGLYALNTDTGEHELYRCDTDTWHKSKLDDLKGYERYGNYYLKGSSKKKFTGGISEACTLIEKRSQRNVYRYDLEEQIDRMEDSYSVDVREKRENNRQTKIGRLMSRVPNLPENFEDWILRVSGNDRYYALHGEDNRLHCSCCGSVYQGDKKTGQQDICGGCGKEVTVDRRSKTGRERDVHAVIIQDIDNEMAVARHFDVIIYHGTRRSVVLSESERLIIYRSHPKYHYQVFYAQDPRGCLAHRFDDKRNVYNRQVFDGYLYPGRMEMLKGTIHECGIRALASMAECGMKLNYGKMMCAVIDERIAGITEYLVKGRFDGLLKDLAKECGYFGTKNWNHAAELNLNGKTPEEIFGLNRQNINRLRDRKGDAKTLEWIRWSEKQEKKLDDETIEWLTRNNFRISEIVIVPKMSPKQVMNYIVRQRRESYPEKSERQVRDQWIDYLRMCGTLEKDTSDEMVYRPRELKRRHQECVEEIRSRQAIIDMKNNKKASEERAEKLRADYPLAENILKAIKPKYEYQTDQYRILVPDNLVEITLEGHALHHCVASSDRYFERIERQETYICFLRRTEKPDTPFYTIEIEPGGTIRQHRSYYDEEPGIEEIRGFLREWQKEVKKRLNEEDRRLAKESQKLREENIKELKKKNNTRVLLGLMEDFLEAGA